MTFRNWLRSHGHKGPEERWLRELYPWPVFAQVDCCKARVGQPQSIFFDGARYDVTLKSVDWQPEHGTHKYRLLVESEGLGWHSRSYSDDYYMCGSPDGTFVSVFHKKKKEPLEKIARAFFARRWLGLKPDSFKSLAVSRFLAASVVGQVAEQVFQSASLKHYPGGHLLDRVSPMFASGSDLWIGHRFFSEDAYDWARRSAGSASRVIAIYFADTKYQFNTELPPTASVHSVMQLNSTELGGKFEDLIQVLLRGLQIPTEHPSAGELASIVLGSRKVSAAPVVEADVHEALAALKRPCQTKKEFRYQLAAAVVLNAWIESERQLGYPQRKKFYAFKKRVDDLVKWATKARLPDVTLWAETVGENEGPIMFVRIDGVDFSFHAIPSARFFLTSGELRHNWSGVRLKPIAPFVLGWARGLMKTSAGASSRAV